MVSLARTRRSCSATREPDSSQASCLLRRASRMAPRQGAGSSRAYHGRNPFGRPKQAQSGRPSAKSATPHSARSIANLHQCDPGPGEEERHTNAHHDQPRGADDCRVEQSAAPGDSAWDPSKLPRDPHQRLAHRPSPAERSVAHRQGCAGAAAPERPHVPHGEEAGVCASAAQLACSRFGSQRSMNSFSGISTTSKPVWAGTVETTRSAWLRSDQTASRPPAVQRGGEPFIPCADPGLSVLTGSGAR